MMGAPPEVIEALEAEAQVEELEVLPENWPTVQAWLRVQTQWRVGGMGSPVGLDYAAVDVAMRRGRIDDPEGLIFEGLQVMEHAALGALKG